ncbi:hypothetical protein DV735_g3723, partial [Chaetothyriales sp. CBS 134920]
MLIATSSKCAPLPNTAADDKPLKPVVATRTHPRATSHGTYLRGILHDLEDLEDYDESGYHPVYIGDTLGTSSRYRVIHKLGHGGFGTVWLCRDQQSPGYVAVKVMTADMTSDDCPELVLISKLDRSLPGAEYIVNPLDFFSVVGPNGTHLCVVLPVLGPCVSPWLWRDLGQDPGHILRGMAYQAALAMSCLHKQGICHGDFRPSNILVKLNLAALNQLTEPELLSRLGEPRKSYVCTESGEDIPAFQPRYLTVPADIADLGSEYLTDQICVIDFGESYPVASPPPELGIPQQYQPPELLLELEHPVGLASDLWALACTLFEIRQQTPLFHMIDKKDDLIAYIFRCFGKPPQLLWDKWDARQKYFDDQGRWIRHSSKWSLKVALSRDSQCLGAEPKQMVTPEEEQALMADLLYKLCRYEPERRLSAEDVLGDQWFKFKI